MEALDHITAGRTVIRALLVAVVLTAGIAGPVGTVAAEPIDGKGNDVLVSLDGKGNDVLGSLDGVSNTARGNDVLGSLDGKGNDVVTYRFPINNFTLSVDSDYAGRGGGSGKPTIQ